MKIPDCIRKYWLALVLVGAIHNLKAQPAADIGVINVDSIVENSLIGDSSTTFINGLLSYEQKAFRDSFELFDAVYSSLMKEASAKTFFSQKQGSENMKHIKQMSQRLSCMEHLATSIELLYEEELRYFVSEELRRHTEKVKQIAQVNFIVTHKGLNKASVNEQEEFSFLSLNQLFINVVQNSAEFQRRWQGFKQQITLKIAALKLNMHQHCFNN